MKNSCSQSVIGIFVSFFWKKESKEKDVNGADSRVSGYLPLVIKIKALLLLLSSVLCCLLQASPVILHIEI